MVTDSHGASRPVTGVTRDKRDTLSRATPDPDNCSPVEERLGRVRARARVSLARAQREAGCWRICRQLAAEVAALSPPGLGKHDDVWQAVAPADAALQAALTTWRDTGHEVDKARVRTAYAALLRAWTEQAAKHAPVNRKSA